MHARPSMVARLLRSADFQRVLSLPPCSRSAHFAAHHLPACPSLPAGRVARPGGEELSTADAPACPLPVDDSAARSPGESWAGRPSGHWLGLVVPKRHARRSVTRNLLKRQMRSLMAAQAGALEPGLWVLRLKAPFDRARFVSPASDQLREAARAELALLLQRAAARA
ncbi:MAG: ribonuclease P protein component [Burkholderiaceae bacterium]|nr:ribonuclease P protein component [Burkholderiaceae bacterium]